MLTNNAYKLKKWSKCDICCTKTL